MVMRPLGLLGNEAGIPPILYIMDVNALLPHGPTRPVPKLASARPHVLPFIDFKFWPHEVCRPQPILHP